LFDTHAPTRKVLIVDDEYIPRSLESFALEGTGRYYTVEAGNATDALTLLSGEEYDAVVIDMSMPDMSGVDLIKMIRRNLENRDFPIVLVLPNSDGVRSEDIGLCGASRIIAKPFQPWDLARLLDSLTNAIGDTGHILSVDTVLRGFPYPTMILDEEHHVLLANGAFYANTDTGIDECYVTCNHEMHQDGEVPHECPLDACVRTGETSEHTIETVLGTMRVSVYPLAITTGANQRLYLHVTQPIG
jgi:CheY-like chemotaxis protein